MTYQCKIYGAKSLQDQKQVYVIAFPSKASRSERIDTLKALLDLNEMNQIIIEYLFLMPSRNFVCLREHMKNQYELSCNHEWPITADSVDREQLYELDWWIDNEMKKKITIIGYSDVGGSAATIETVREHEESERIYEKENPKKEDYLSKRFHPVQPHQAFDTGVGSSVGVVNVNEVQEEKVVEDVHEGIDVEKTKTELRKSFISRILYILKSRWTMELVGEAFWDPIAEKMVYYHEDCFGVRYMTFAKNRIQAFFFHRLEIENTK